MGAGRDAGDNVLSISGVARARRFQIGCGAENKTRSRRVSFAAIKRATAAAAAQVSRASWELQGEMLWRRLQTRAFRLVVDSEK